MTEGDTASWKDQWLDELDTKAKKANTPYMDFDTYDELIMLLEKNLVLMMWREMP